MPRPETADYAEYYGKYINLVKEDDLMLAFQNQQLIIDDFFKMINEERSNISYAEGKWSIKEVFQHIIDGERVFSYRSMAVARGEKNSLPGFDQDAYANSTDAANRNWKDLQEEFLHLRQSTIDLFKSLSATSLLNKGLVNGNPITALSIGYIILGHTIHHINIIKERYLA